ncbi:MAG: FecR domain-containing protein [Bacteroidetes bacterium]|nr:FecR domain-containing protein [Bacteroidota bacterium]
MPDKKDGIAGLKERPISEEQITAATNRLLAALDRLKKPSQIPTIGKWIAAACVLALVAGVYSQYHRPVLKGSWSTPYGEIRKAKLPDGTTIIANANTRLTYPVEWQEGGDREVWLEGEAFFHVQKTPSKSRFIVHMGRFDIVVTGTQFNAVNRIDRASILLQEGSVILKSPDLEEMALRPGDFAEFLNGRLTKRSVKADSCVAWKDRRLFLDNTPLSQLIQIIKEQYGTEVHRPEGSTEKTVSGILPNDNLDVLLRALELTGDFKIIHENDKIIIKDP